MAGLAGWRWWRRQMGCRARASRQRAAAPHSQPPCSSRRTQATRSQLFEACDGELFEEAGLVVSKEAWRKKEIRSHTKHVYTQRK